jgi:hypothetical protein
MSDRVWFIGIFWKLWRQTQVEATWKQRIFSWKNLQKFFKILTIWLILYETINTKSIEDKVMLPDRGFFLPDRSDRYLVAKEVWTTGRSVKIGGWGLRTTCLSVLGFGVWEICFQWDQPWKFFSNFLQWNQHWKFSQTFPKKINIQTTNQSVQNFWGLETGV